MPGLQEFIHKLEEGEGAAVLRKAMAVLLLLVVGIVYDLRVARNFATEEAMDTAQLARNISEGKGFVTDYVRPFDLYVIGKHKEGNVRLEAHPDLHHPPLYPVLLGGLMKVLPFNYDVANTQMRHFSRYQPEMLIMIFNQVLFLLNAILLFRLAKRLFDPQVAWFAVAAFFGTELFWRFTTAAVGTQLSILLVLAIIWLLARFDEEQTGETPNEKKLLIFGALAGLMLGLLFLNRYALAVLLLPSLVFLAFGKKIRIMPAAACGIVFLAAAAPWMVRNVAVSGNPLAVAGYAIYAKSGFFEEQDLHRTMDAAYGLQQASFRGIARKFVTAARDILTESKTGARWLMGLFLIGMLAPFRREGLNRLRFWVLGSWIMVFAMQALTKSHLSDGVGGVTTENLLVVLTPLIFVFAVALFFILLDQMSVPFPQVKILVQGLFLIAVSAGLLLQLLPPKTFPVVYPPYHPPLLQQVSRWAGDNELLMSDIPWAVAWYGDRQVMGLTMSGKVVTGQRPVPAPGKDFYAVNDDIKTVSGIILSPKFMDSPYGSGILEDSAGWGRIVLQSLTVGEVPKGFPLKASRGDLLPSHFVLFDWERWRGKKQ